MQPCPEHWKIGDRVLACDIDLHGRREVRYGIIKGFHPHRDKVLVTWDGNQIGAVQGVPQGRLQWVS